MPKIYLVSQGDDRVSYTGMLAITKDYDVAYRTLVRHITGRGFYEKRGIRVDKIDLIKIKR